MKEGIATPPQTLEEALDNIRELYQQEQVAKRGSREQVKDAHRALRDGYQKARECLKRELPDLQTSSVYRHAFVAKHYSREDRQKWGVAKLQTLASIQTRAHGKPLPGDPADQEVHITREDGSVIAKKFSDCSWRELQSAAKRQKEAHQNAGRVVDELAKSPGPVSKRSPPALSGALAIVGVGVLASFVGNLLSPAAHGVWISVFSLVLLLAGTAALVRYVAVRRRFFAAFKEQGRSSPTRSAGS